MTTPKSVDTTEADLEEVLKGLKQDQLDKLAKELSKKSKPEDMNPKWNEAKGHRLQRCVLWLIGSRHLC